LKAIRRKQMRRRPNTAITNAKSLTSRSKRWLDLGLHGLLIPVLAVLALVTFSATPVGALTGTYCGTPSTNHCYSVAYSSNGSWTGFVGNWHANYMTPGSTSAAIQNFTDSEMWLLANVNQNNGDPEWGEMGIINGWDVSLASPAYGSFVGWFNPYGTFFWQYLDTFSPTGATYTFQMSRGTTVNNWTYYQNGMPRIYIQSNWWLGTYGLGGGEFYTATTYSAPFPHADTFDMNLSLVNGSGSVVTYPIGSTNIHSGFNGISYGAGEWSWNAP
jgi:hypothetical protein